MDLGLMPTSSGLPGTGQLLLRPEGQILSCRSGGNDPTARVARTIRSENASTGLTFNLAQSKPGSTKMAFMTLPVLLLASQVTAGALLPLRTYAWGPGVPEQPQQREGSRKSREAGRLGRTWEAFPGVWLSLVPS